MSGYSITTDSSAVLAGIQEHAQKSVRAIQKSLAKVGFKKIERAVTLAPRPPIASGNLRGSAAVAVGGQVIRQMMKGDGINDPDVSGMSQTALRVSFNTDYAARFHERADWKPRPKPDAPGEESLIGPKYLSSKEEKYAEEDKRLLAELIREELGG